MTVKSNGFETSFISCLLNNICLALLFISSKKLLEIDVHILLWLIINNYFLPTNNKICPDVVCLFPSIFILDCQGFYHTSQKISHAVRYYVQIEDQLDILNIF